jgi:hypothetical protein
VRDDEGGPHAGSSATYPDRLFFCDDFVQEIGQTLIPDVARKIRDALEYDWTGRVTVCVNQRLLREYE